MQPKEPELEVQGGVQEETGKTDAEEGEAEAGMWEEEEEEEKAEGKGKEEDKGLQR